MRDRLRGQRKLTGDDRILRQREGIRDIFTEDTSRHRCPFAAGGTGERPDSPRTRPEILEVELNCLPMTFAALCLALSPVAEASGHVSYTLEKASAPTADQLDAYARIEAAMDSAIGYYNAYTTLRKKITVQYEASVPTAEASYNGTLRFGSSRSYMYVGTAMHEIAHTIGVGTTTEYKALIVNGVFTGSYATQAIRAVTGDSTALLKGDAQHIWPYGLNYASEVKSTADLVNHCRIVEGIYRDLFHESVVFEGRIRSKATGNCMVRTGTSLTLGSCTDTGSLARLVSIGDTSPTYRIEFGDRVLDAPNRSSTAGLAMGLYTWNSGTNQQMRIEGGTPAPAAVVQLRMVHSSLLLEAGTAQVVQNPTKSGSQTQAWELAAQVTTAIGTRAGRTKSAIEPPRKPVDASGRLRIPLPSKLWPTPGF